MTLSPAAHPTVAEHEERAREACPGWDIWAIRTLAGRNEWSARPEGALAAVVTGLDSAAKAVSFIRAYTGNLALHIEETRKRIDSLNAATYAADEKRVLEALVTALTMFKG